MLSFGECELLQVLCVVVVISLSDVYYCDGWFQYVPNFDFDVCPKNG